MISHPGFDSTLPTLTSEDPRVSVGCYTYGNPRLLLWTDRERIQIGKYCSIAENVTILGGGEHRTDWVTTFPLSIAFGLAQAWQDGIPATKGPTVIGNDVWIGYGAMILSGVHIGDGAVIGAGSVVSGHVPAYAIAAGNPGKLIKMRFPPEIVESLGQIKWWDWPVHQVLEASKLLMSSDVSEFLKYAQKFK